VNRSKITASAAMEQMSSGQIGQPAACIIEKNMCLSRARFGRPPAHPPRADYGVRAAADSSLVRDILPHAAGRSFHDVRHPPQPWTTLWTTTRGRAMASTSARRSSDC
jgi:hypothetical protein